MQAIAPWKAVVDQEGLREIGTTLFPLQKGPCMSRECNLGNFIADAMVYYYASQMKHDEDEWTASSIALIQTGGIRTDLGKGGKCLILVQHSSPFTTRQIQNMLCNIFTSILSSDYLR